MRVLALTNMLPSPENPRSGTFVEQQIQGLRGIGVDLDVLLIDRPNNGMLEYRKTAPRLRAALASGRFDVLHVMYGGLLADLALGAAPDLPSVVSFCGVDLLGAPYAGLLFRLRTQLGVHASHRAARRADQIIVKSRNLERGLPADVHRSRVSIIPNGVSLERFRPLDRDACRRRLGWDPGVFHVLFSTCNRKDSKKRLPLAEAAVELLNHDGLKTQIHGLSNIPHDEVPVWLNAADVMLLTSRSDEGSPNIIKEALACDRPVVSTDVGDVAERIEGVEGCHLVEPSPSDIAAKLRVVAAGPRAVSGRRHVEPLSIERVARRLVEVYERALTAPKDAA